MEKQKGFKCDVCSRFLPETKRSDVANNICQDCYLEIKKSIKEDVKMTEFEKSLLEVMKQIRDDIREIRKFYYKKPED